MRNTFGFNVTRFMVLLCIVLGHGVSAAYAPNMGNQGIRVHNNHHLRQVDNVFDVPFAQNNLNNNALVEQGSMQQENYLASLPPLVPSSPFFSNELPHMSSLPSNGLNNNAPLNDQASIGWDQRSIRDPSPCFTRLTRTPLYPSLENSYNNPLVQNTLNHGQQRNSGLFNDGASIRWNNNAPTDFNASPCFTLSTTIPFDVLESKHNNPLLQNNNLNYGQETNNGFPIEQPPSIAWDNESTGFNFNPPSCFTQPTTAPRYASFANNYNEPPTQNNLNSYQDLNIPLPTFRSQEQPSIGLQEKGGLATPYLSMSSELTTTPDNQLTSTADASAILPATVSSSQQKKRKVTQEIPRRHQPVLTCSKTNISLSKQCLSFLKKKTRPQKKGKFVCDMCGKSFTQKSNLKTHIRGLHRKEKRYQCHYCTKSFSQKIDLKRHLFRHTGERPYSCLLCKKSFIRNDWLKRHVQEFHIKKKSFVCVVCGKSCTQKGSLVRHMKSVHMKQKPHKCSQCNKVFARKDYLNEHIKRIHQKKKRIPM